MVVVDLDSVESPGALRDCRSSNGMDCMTSVNGHGGMRVNQLLFLCMCFDSCCKNRIGWKLVVEGYSRQLKAVRSWRREGRWRFLFELSFSPTRLVVFIYGNSSALEGANEELLLRTAHTARYFVGNHQPWWLNWCCVLPHISFGYISMAGLQCPTRVKQLTRCRYP